MECLQAGNWKGALQGVNWRIQVHPFVYTMSWRSARSRRRNPKFRSLIFLSRAKVPTILPLSWKPVANFTASKCELILLIETVSRRIFKETLHILIFVFITRQFIFCLNSFSRVSRPGSVVAIVQLLFENSTIDPLQPLQEEISDGNLVAIQVNPVFYPQEQVCVNTPFIAVYFYDSSVNSISAAGPSFLRWRGILSHLNFC